MTTGRFSTSPAIDALLPSVDDDDDDDDDDDTANAFMVVVESRSLRPPRAAAAAGLNDLAVLGADGGGLKPSASDGVAPGSMLVRRRAEAKAARAVAFLLGEADLLELLPTEFPLLRRTGRGMRCSDDDGNTLVPTTSVGGDG